MLLRQILLLLPAVMVVTVSSASPVNLQNGLAHNRTSRGQDCYEDEYEHKGICCKNCPAGTYVSIHCTLTHHRGACEPCDSGESFTAYPNGMESCLPCLTCTADKVLVKECTPTSNAECECKPGYYCTPGEPCEICARCSRCGEGQRMKKNCTSSSNTVCEDVSPPKPTSTKANVKDQQTGTAATNFFENVTGIKAAPTEPPDDSAKSKTVTTIISIVGVFLIIVILLIAGIYLWKRYHTENNKNSLIDTTQNTSVNTSLDSVMTEGNDSREEERCPERQHLMTPEPVTVEHEVNRTAVPYERVAQSEPMENNTAEPLGGDEENEEIPQLGTPCGECNNPQPCERQWADFFYLVIENACVDRRLEHARKLHLRKATIAQTLNDNANNCKEQYFQLLEQWRNQKGTQASMKAVLRVLQDMDLGGCCENITNSLRAQKIPMN